METHIDAENGNSDREKLQRSTLKRLLGLLRAAKNKLTAGDDRDLTLLLNNLSEIENGSDQYDVDPFIRPEYPPAPADRRTSPDPSDGNNKKYRKPPYEYIDTDWHLGWTDGRCGQPENVNENIVSARVQVEAEEEFCSIKAKIAAKETIIAGLAELLERRNQPLTRQEEFYTSLNEKRNQNFLEFSRPLGYLYLAFAMILFLADIPLSLKLVASGFQVPVEADLPPDVSAIGSSKKLLIDHLLFHPWYVLGMFWESLALAAGIAFIGIIVKYYVDLIVLRDNDAKRPRWLAIVILTIVLSGFIGTTIVLGNFRAEQQVQAVRREIEANLKSENEQNKQFNKDHPNAQPRSVIPESGLDAEVSKRFNAKQGVTSSRWLTSTFIALTLLLPIIGGISFSASGSRLRNAKLYSLAAADYKRLKKEYETLILRLKKAEGDLKGLRDKLAQMLADSGRLKAREDLKRNLYLHGYARGRTVPETLEDGASLYELCQKTVVKLLAKKAREKIADG